MTTVELNETEKKIALHIAKLRYGSNRKNNVFNNMAATNMTELQPDIYGAESEMAMCKLLGVYPLDLFDIYVRSAKNGDDFGDIVYNNKVIDVKSTVYKTGCLLAITKNINIDLFILMTGKDGVYTCNGGIKSSDLYKEENYGNNNGKFRQPCYFVTQDKLTPYKKLLDIA